jgi:hypothetical protein
MVTGAVEMRAEHGAKPEHRGEAKEKPADDEDGHGRLFVSVARTPTGAAVAAFA